MTTMHFDSWAIGVIIYQLCCNGEHPYPKEFYKIETMKDRVAFLKTNFINFENEHFKKRNPIFKEFIKKLMNINTQQRWTVGELINRHEFQKQF